MNRVVGIDYSMSSPAICCIGEDFTEFTYWTTKRKYECNVSTQEFSIKGELLPEYKTNEERFDYLANEVTKKVLWYWPNKIILEGYSYASTGRAFSIGENIGVLKNKFHVSKAEVQVVAPTQVKKFATGKGNANKELMEQSFIEETGWDVKKAIAQPEHTWNPSSDIIDAYYIAKYGENL